MAPRATPGRRSATLQPVSRLRLYEQLVERLLDYIHGEGMKVGDRLRASSTCGTATAR